MSIYSESKNVELLAYIILAVCVILIYNFKEIHDDLANNSALLLDGLCKLVHLRDS
jgi:hypothetical protein